MKQGLEHTIVGRGAAQSAPSEAILFGRNATKINPPAVGDAILSDPLADRISAGLIKPLVWVHAAPGAGKTTLVARFLTERGIDPIWFRADSDDSDPAAFFIHASLAVARLDEAYADRLPPVRPEYLRDPTAFARRFFRALFDTTVQLTFVIDDYHEMDNTSPLHRCIAEGLREIPPGAHVIVVSRTPPPMEFASARLKGLVEVVPPHVLKLTTAEAGDIAARRDLHPTPEHVAAVVEQAQGWAAGIVLILEAAKPGARILAPPAPELPELLFDYFAGEIFHLLEDCAQRALTTLALMPSIPAAFVAFLTEDESAIDLIEDFAKRSYFTSFSGDPEAHYRFHPLFREFLLRQFRRTFDAAARTRLKRRAALALEQAGHIECAVPLYHEIEAWDDLVSLIVRWAPQAVERGLNPSVLGWIKQLPPDRVEGHGWLAYWRASTCFAASPRRSRPLFATALSLLREAGDIDGLLLSWVGLVSSITEDPGSNQSTLDDDIALYFDMTRDMPAFPSPIVEFRVSLAMYLALVRRTGDRTVIAIWRDRALASAVTLGKPGLSILIRYYIVLYALIDSDFATVREQIAILPPPESLGREPLLQQVAHVAIGLGQSYGQLPGRCDETAELAFAISKETGVYLWSHFQAGFEAITESDLPRARKWMQRTAKLTGKVAAYHSAHYQIMAAAVALLAGDIDSSIRSGRIAVEMTKADGWFLYEAMARISLAQALESAGRREEADAELTGAEAAVGRIACLAIKVSIDMLHADFLLERGRDAEGIDALEAAMAWGERTGARRTMLMPVRNSRLCARALREGIRPRYALMLIQASNLPACDRALEAWPWPLKIVTLGGFGIFLNGEPLAGSRKTPRRLLTLLKAIVAFGGISVPETKLMDAIWPDEDGDAAKSALDVAIHRLRKLLGSSQAILVKNGRVGIDPMSCWLDVWAFESLASANEPHIRLRAATIYKGPFLPEEDRDWVRSRRAKLAAVFAKACGHMGSTPPRCENRDEAPSRLVV